MIGGPLATIHALKHNFDTLENTTGTRMVIRWGIAGIVVMLSMLPFVPPDFPQFIMPLAYSFGAKLVASQFQLSREQIAADARYDFMPTGQLLNRCLLGLIAFVLLSVVWLGTLDNLGVIQLPEPPTASLPAPDTIPADTDPTDTGTGT